MDEMPGRMFHGFVRLLEVLIDKGALDQSEAEAIIDEAFGSPEPFEPNRSHLSKLALAKMIGSRNP